MTQKLFLFDIFSYSCMNCLRSLSYIKKINDKYAKHGLKTILIHTPEWDFEKDSNNILKAAKEHNLKFPIIIDKGKKIIKKLKISFWPAQILIKDKKIVYKHIGEGYYKKLENKVMEILKIKSDVIFDDEPRYSKYPTIYAGKKKKGIVSKLKDELKFGIIYKKGTWKQNNESLQGSGTLTIKTKGNITNFVARSLNNKGISLKIKVNDKMIKKIKIDEPKLYKIIELKNNEVKTLRLETKSKLAVYSFASQ
jgi:thiol-disulfide isomerase/thioredoxin